MFTDCVCTTVLVTNIYVTAPRCGITPCSRVFTSSRAASPTRVFIADAAAIFSKHVHTVSRGLLFLTTSHLLG